MTNKYVFEESLSKNKQYEKFLDDYFSKIYKVTKTQLILDMAGVDRIFEDIKAKHRLSVEYKTDHIGHKTNNFFVEVQIAGQPGWFYTSLCQTLIVYFPEIKKIIRLDFLKFKREVLLKAKQNEFKQKKCENVNYSSTGLLVPIPFLQEIGTVFDL